MPLALAYSSRLPQRHELPFGLLRSKVGSVRDGFDAAFRSLINDMKKSGLGKVCDDMEKPIWHEFRAAQECDYALRETAKINVDIGRARKRHSVIRDPSIVPISIAYLHFGEVNTKWEIEQIMRESLGADFVE